MRVCIREITQENVKDIPEPCRTCLYWENPTFIGEKLSQTEKARCETEKAAWFIKILKMFGNCGKIIYVDNKPVGYAQYSTANRLPNTQEYGAKKLETTEDVVFISCLYISNESSRGKGLGERLLDEVVKGLKRRGFKAVETFARKGSANNPSGPVELYLKKGFKVVEEIAPDFALIRLKL